MQLTAARANRVPPPAPAPKAAAPRGAAPRGAAGAPDARLLLRHPEARERDPLLDWIQRGQGEASKARRKGSALALAISAALHAALVLAAGGLLLAPKIAPVESPAGKVVYVNLRPKVAQRAAALPAVPPATRSQRSQAPAQRSAPPESLSRPPSPPAELAPSAPPAIAGESVAPPIVALPNAVAASDRSRGAPSPPDRAVPAPVSSEPSTPAYLYSPEPEYPRSAREDGQEGLVVLRVLVSSAGRPAEIRVSRTSGFRALDAAAVAGVKRWTFVAAKQGERDIDAWMDVPIRFHLR